MLRDQQCILSGCDANTGLRKKDVWMKNKGIGHLKNVDDVHGNLIMKHNISETNLDIE